MKTGADIRRADVTSTSPLEVRFTGQGLAVPAVATDVTVALFDEVLVAMVERQVYIIVKIT